MKTVLVLLLGAMLAGACGGGKGSTTNQDGSVPMDGGPSGPCSAAQLAVGSYHACVRSAQGGVWCWGKNEFGQLGDGSNTDRHLPTPVASLSGVADLKASGYRSCARKTDGTLWCWGYNVRGEIGDGTVTHRNSPVQVASLGDVAEFVMGVSHSCARKTDGSWWCWGSNTYGELVSGGAEQQPTPVAFAPLDSAPVELALGGGFVCARRADGTVWCWGYNLYGQAGDGTFVDRTTPAAVMGLSDVAHVVSSGSHSCARKNDGTMWCWGANWLGQLGDGMSSNRALPVQVTPLGADVAEPYVPTLHSCARKTDGTLWCWGWNEFGQLGATTADGWSPLPVEASTVGSLSQVGLGMNHTCALETDSSLWCWGSNEFGQLGDDTTVNSDTATGVVGCP